MKYVEKTNTNATPLFKIEHNFSTLNHSAIETSHPRQEINDNFKKRLPRYPLRALSPTDKMMKKTHFTKDTAK